MMLSLSMVVLPQVIGANGSWKQVYLRLSNDAGGGFAAGLAIVILAIILDRITQAINRTKVPKS